MKKINFIIAVVIFFAVNLSATNHTVNTLGITFSPSNLTISVGDSVTFVNTGGFHNVNGTISTFPLNPASFENPGGVSSGWSYSYVFTIAGNYGYQCDPHLPGMIGQITVNSSPSSQLVVTTTSATSVSANDGQAIATINTGIGNYTYYWENLSTGIPAFGPNTISAIADTFVNAPSGTYILSFIDNGAAFFTTDTFTITAAAGNFSYLGSMGLCGVTSTDLTAYLNGCTYPNQVLDPKLSVNIYSVPKT